VGENKRPATVLQPANTTNAEDINKVKSVFMMFFGDSRFWIDPSGCRCWHYRVGYRRVQSITSLSDSADFPAG
jgi:hypothetical protein